MKPFRPVGGTPGRKCVRYVKLKGVDMSTDPTQIGEDFSPWCPNLISDNGGNPEKRPGWRTLYRLRGPVNGIWRGRVGKDHYYFIHAGTELYLGKDDSVPMEIKTGLQSAKSTGFFMNERFWLLTGREYVVCGVFQNLIACKNVTDIAYVPTVVIARSPGGGGTPLEPINLLGLKQINSFLTTDARTYQLTATGLDSVDKVVLNGVEKTAGADYTVNINMGTVTFTSAMPAPPVAGADNLQITFSKYYEGYS